MIAALARLHSNAETIGSFRVSPRGRSPDGIRVVWMFQKVNDTIKILICDLVYHVRGNQYVDDWNVRAGKGDITKEAYSDWTPLPDQLRA
jgi:hypothetical protein